MLVCDPVGRSIREPAENIGLDHFGAVFAHFVEKGIDGVKKRIPRHMKMEGIKSTITDGWEAVRLRMDGLHFQPWNRMIWVMIGAGA